MPLNQEKRLWSLKIDREFKELIRPLFKSEFLQLEANIVADGCREPITVWNGIIIDGHNRYKICTEHGIPFAITEKSFSSREDAIIWICTNQLGRRNLTEESRKFLIGKQYESEKIISRRKAVYQASCEDGPGLPYETFNPNPASRVVETHRKTAQKIADENHISHGTVEKYSIYSRAIEEISKKEPHMAMKILSGRYKISHDGVIALSKRSVEEIQDLNRRLERSQHPFARYQTTRHEIQNTPSAPIETQIEPKTVKDMPKYDPDAEVVGLTLTIPSWSSSIDRIVHSDLTHISSSARDSLRNALLQLQDSIDAMFSAIKEER